MAEPGRVPGFSLRKRAAFSLVELFVSIAVVALLMGLLLPVLSDARERGRAVACASNLRQVMTGSLTFLEDSPGRMLPFAAFPIFPEELGTAEPKKSWVYTLKPYVDPHGVAVCPSDGSPHWDLERPDMTGRLREVSYGINGVIGARLFMEGLWPPAATYEKRTDTIERPSNVVVYGELPERGYNAIGDSLRVQTWGFSPGPGSDWELAHDRHHGAPQWAFFDGHVAPHRLPELYQVEHHEEATGTVTWVHNKFHPLIAR